ncbi:NACHT domain-containing protein [Streptomyces sp. NPDC014006]|uniref:NACHT domain-containing protein n=1 Tax=Streptomyces sp. NPDC014006 TaxID=3364870 RepID=UPI0036F9AD9D
MERWRRVLRAWNGRPAGPTVHSISGGEFHAPVIQAETAKVTFRNLRPGPREWAAELAAQVHQLESAECRRLLGHADKRLNLEYTRVAQPGREASNAALTGRQLADAEGIAGIIRYYRELDPGRLVITGAAGAGKTVLAMELMITLLEERQAGDPVPVRIPLADWPTGRGFTDFLTDVLHKTYRWSERKARRLVKEGWVLPVLDGLDEMDPPQANGKPDPAAPRARAALRGINGHHRGLRPGPVILTCRGDAYDVLAAGWCSAESSRLLDAAQVQVNKVRSATALTYLTERATDQARWRELLAYLQTRPNSPLARLLSTPWRLCLVATVYDAEGHPDELTRFHTARKLDQHLLSLYIPALLKPDPTQPSNDPPRHSPTDVHRWLHQLAHYLQTSGDNGEPRTVLTLHELWRMLPRKSRLMQNIMIVGGWMSVDFITGLLPLHHSATAEMTEKILGFGVPGLLAASTRFWRNPRSLGAGARMWTQPVWTVLQLTILSALALLLQANNWHFGLSSTALLPLYVLVVGTYVTPSRPVRSPRSVLRDDLVAGVVTGTLMGLISPFGQGHDAHDLAILAVAEGALITVSFTGGLSQLHLAFAVTACRILPFRLGTFLDWATDLGLLRLAGPAYQFRHRELQEWLATTPLPPRRR